MLRVFWDTNLFIYLVEGSAEFGALTIALAERMKERGDQIYTSTLTLGEVLIHPERFGRSDLRKEYEEVLSRRATLIPFDKDTARIYSRIQAQKKIKASDAIQLACAAQCQADLFVTNDDELTRAVVPEVKFITTLSKCPI